MNGAAQYVGGLLLCLAVALVYSLTRTDTPRAAAKKTLVVFVYILGTIAGMTLVVLVLTRIAARM